MVKTLYVYDYDGVILKEQSGQPALRIPVGVPYIYEEVPEGKQTKSVGQVGVDVSVTPNKLILEDIPPSEIELLRVETAQANTELFEMLIMMGGGV